MKKTYQSTTIMTLFVSISGIITGILVNRALGPENRGLLTTITFWQPLIAIFATLGVHESISYFLGRYPNSPRSKNIIKAQFYTNILLTILGLVIGLPYLYFFVADKLGEQAHLSYLYLFFIPIYIFSMNLQGVYLGQQKYRFFNLFRFLHSLIYFLGIVFLFAVNSENISNYVALFLLSQALATLPLIKPLAQFTFGKFELKYVKLILKKGSLFYLPFLLAVYSTQWDLLVVVKQLNFEEIGLYQAAYTIANGSTLIISLTFQYLVFPIATRLSHQNERALFIVENYFLAIIGLFLLAGLISFSARWIIPILFGQSFLGSVPILQLLVWGYALISSKIVASKSVKALSDGKLSFNIELVYAAIFLLGASSLLWLEIFDLTKLCYLIFISGLISNLYFTFSIKRKYQLRWREIFNIKKAIQRLIKGLS